MMLEPWAGAGRFQPGSSEAMTLSSTIPQPSRLGQSHNHHASPTVTPIA